MDIITLMILDIFLRPVFNFKHSIWENEFYIHLQLRANQMKTEDSLLNVL
jgi:hypothetical protein